MGGRPILERLLDQLAPIEAIDGTYAITNAKFAPVFREWAESYSAPRPGLAPTVVDDGTTEDSNKLGAIGDFHLLITREGLDDDVILSAGDSVFSESLEGFGRAVQERNAATLERRVYPVPAEIDAEIARLKLETMGIEIDTLTEEQAKYLASWDEGT